MEQYGTAWMDLTSLMSWEEVRHKREHSKGFHLLQVPTQAKLIPAVGSQKLPLGRGGEGAQRLSGVREMLFLGLDAVTQCINI